MTGRKRDIDDLAGEIQELFADMWQVPRFSAGLRQGYRPQADCYRTEDPPALTVVVELPGVEPASVEVVVAGRALTVSGERTRPRVEGAHYLAMEIEYGSFQRRIELGVDVDPTNVTANYDKGMLRVHLPLAPQRREEKVNIEVRRLDGAPDAEAPALPAPEQGQVRRLDGAPDAEAPGSPAPEQGQVRRLDGAPDAEAPALPAPEQEQVRRS